MHADQPLPPSSPPSAISRWQRWCEVGLIFLVFLVIGGEAPPHNNEPHYLCRAKHFWNPTWCQGDLFLDSPDAHLVFVWATGWLTKWLALPATAWVGRIVCWLGLAWAWQRLSWLVVPHRLYAVLSASLFVTLIQQGHFSGEWVVGGFEAKCIAYVLVLLAVEALVAARWNRVWILLGGATAVHALVGSWSAVVCGVVWLWDGRRQVPLRSMLPGLAVSFVLALAGIVPALMLSWNEAADVVAEANRIYVFERLPHHLAPLSLPAGELAERSIRHGLLLIVLATLGMAANRIMARDRGARPAAERLQTIRHFAWGAVGLAAAGLIIEVVFASQPLVAAAWLKYYWFRLTDVAVPLAVALHVAAVAAEGMRRRAAWSMLLLAASLGLAGWQLVHVTYERVPIARPPADSKMRDYDDWVDACEWVAKYTPRDARFLTPRLANSFKWRTGRPEVVTHKDIPQSAAHIVEWHRRLKDIFYEQEEGELQPIRSLGHLGTQRILEIAREYDVDYILTDRRRPLGLKMLYPNDPSREYVVYEVPSSNPTQPADAPQP